MSNNKGYVYVLMNPSYNGMVKVGKTTKTPEERAKELSSSTGVATPFVVVYKRFFKNCHAAEKIAHDILTERGCRVNDMREFFSIDTSEAIDVILQIPDNECPEYVNDSFADIEGLDEADVNTDDNELGEAYYNKAEEYYYGLNDQFEDQDKALYYYEKSAALGYFLAYEKLGDIWEDKKDRKKAIYYYTKGVESYHTACYAKLGKLYMDKYGKSYHHNNAVLAWSKYFEYLERHKDSLLTTDEYSAYSVGLNMNSYFRNYLIYGTIPQEHEEFIRKNKVELIRVLSSLAHHLKKRNSGDLFCRDIINDILPYLYGLSDIDDEEDLLELEDVHDYYFGRNGKERNVEKALVLYKKQVAKGNIIGDVFAGICHYNLDQVEQTDKSWKNFYNQVYELFEEEGKNTITSESSKVIVKAFQQMFDFALRTEKVFLIHDYYIIAALKIGYLEYVTEEIQDRLEKLESLKKNINKLKDLETEIPLATLLSLEGYSETLASVKTACTKVQDEMDYFSNAYTFIRGRMAEFQQRYGGLNLMMYRLEN